MAVKVGNSWVSETAYAYAKQRAQLEEMNGDALKSLSDKFPNTSFSTNTAPFSATGVNNIAIAPNILRQMENDPEKRLEYEALIYDCVQLQKSLKGAVLPGGSKVLAQGFIIDQKGNLSSWCISRSEGATQRSRQALSKKEPSVWMRQILGGEKKSSLWKAPGRKDGFARPPKFY